MAKNFTDFSGSLPDSQDAYHIAGDGIFKLINFAVGVGELREEHKRLIEAKLVPFLLAATKALGPGDWHLLCVGMASASGSFSMNEQLSDRRAKSALRHAIDAFNSHSATEPHVKNCTLFGNPHGDGKIEASIDAVEHHIKSYEIDRKQARYRAALFILGARKEHPKGSSTFQIREIYLFNFKTKEEPLPVVLKRLKQFYDSNSVLLLIGKRFRALAPLIEKFSLFMTNIDKALGPEGVVAKMMIKFMIPEETDACYEIKNSEGNHALYRFNGLGHKLEIGIMTLLEFVSEAIAAMKGVIKVLGVISKVPGSADKAVQSIESIMHDFHTQAVLVARQVGDNFAELVDIILTMTENGVTAKAAFAPSSLWCPFRFHDGSANHQVVEPNHRSAQRNVFGAVSHQVVNLDFDGGVTNDWRNFNAEVKITRVIPNVLDIETAKSGFLYLLKGNYPFDTVVGPTNIVID
ncbi:hypothetical protein BTHE68_58910 (plasmid) [Burkholderia sp. THE68]|uniref:hypothetical protein n=1 Tax=Burkholderia sp. THE68 TaxID=758782 RepID=UPI0013178C08|nr:hypothetical protein [Burkholderia sp. THE68]BBU32157.1 hypothetical protein BTHE68_58910 [Burkholderia sp. THE68]